MSNISETKPNQLKVASQDAANKVEHGQFFTMVDCFTGCKPFEQWLDKVGKTTFLEPFAGADNIPKLFKNFLKFDSFDIEPQEKGVVQRDTLADFPQGYSAVITNPPYLAKNSATQKGIDSSTWKHDDLYKVCLEKMLDNVDYVCAIIPESFITSTFDKSRLESVVSLTMKMFEDTDCPVCLAMFGPDKTDGFEIYSGSNHIGNFKDFKPLVFQGKKKITMNDPQGILGVQAVDSTTGPSIYFCRGDKFAPESIKVSSRFYTRITVEGLKEEALESLINCLNKRVDKYREETQDIFMTASKGLRKDGKYRRRLSWSEVKALIETTV